MPNDPVDRLLSEAEIEAELTLGWVRIAAGFALLAGGLVAAAGIGRWDPYHLPQGSSLVPFLSVGAFVALGCTSVLLVATRWFRPWMALPLAVGDVVIIALALSSSLRDSGLGGNWMAAMPIVWAAPLVLTLGALRYRPVVHLIITALLVMALVSVGYHLGFDAEFGDPSGETVARLFSLPPYLMRGLMLVLVGLTAALVMVRGRRLLDRAISETTQRSKLARFLPGELAPLVSTNADTAWREGRRQRATIMFVDIRDFTARAERMDPARLSVFVSSFRRRIMDAADAHGAIVDKFIGDGALIVFGIPYPRPDDSLRAIDCARHLIASVQRWNARRQFAPPLRIGIGIHSGEVYCGVIGDERRLEFTVLGDVVNVAARIEQATKQFDVSLLASGSVVAEAGQTSAWREITSEPLRGRGQHLPVLTPRADQEA